MQVLILRFRWWLWFRFTDKVPDSLCPLFDRICPSRDQLNLLDSLDRSGK